MKQLIKEFKLVQVTNPFHIHCEKFTSSQSACNVAKQLYDAQANHYQEHFLIMHVNRANNLVGYAFLSTGGITGTVADPRLIIANALLSGCTSVILCHNHPSGNLQPSTADKAATQQLKTGLSYVDIKVMDHLILNEDKQYYSFVDNGDL